MLIRFTRPLRRGLTLVEIMMVMATLGMLGVLVMLSLLVLPAQPSVFTVREDLKSIASALEVYRLDNGTYPTTAQGLEALVKLPTRPPLPRFWDAQGYLASLPADPWGSAYQYEIPGTRSNLDYDLFSWGADGEAGGEGENADVGNWAE
ncbi:type II secretion system protein GspG [Pseudomonas sp. SWI6]|uniref:type II secretion system major pseudopilin GspG n=1 Tax=Pseudomonas TaxID=286 RepID=UPI00048A4293|nr:MULTISPECIES: type II secretion system major pseudopilin GspG [Pseudomonas]AVD85258.1 type II secretion system protein GspG [Pseudomonas sp. SWI6]AVD87488.1 type II secretion system protein GspG [Pseudomonas sp. SWI44]MDT8926336.1 type II secretion system major pseudopilin GspG [Pseudomonas taiwanensis]MPS97083.1 type II secretion system protein GspG [Pseudomonas sp.]WEZ89003.1 type II secretion system major pseudopilin GspG [Pseudomonas sp. NyZ480]